MRESGFMSYTKDPSLRRHMSGPIEPMEEGKFSHPLYLVAAIIAWLGMIVLVWNVVP